MKNNLKFWLLLLMLQICGFAAQPYLKGEMSLYLQALQDMDDSIINQSSLRYIPTLSIDILQSGQFMMDAEIAGKISAGKTGESNLALTGEWSRFHRGWIRFMSDRFEARLGLQKITFGPARLFRPLAWFDTIDPRDPLQYTPGVTGLRLRYDFPSNAGLWVWGLYDELDLTEYSANDQPAEIGGRFINQLGPGEISIAYNYTGTDSSESRFGMAGIWDIGIGVWFELSMTNVELAVDPDWQSLLTVGSDYTFGIGNGLTITGEYFFIDLSEESFGNEYRAGLYGLMGNYPVSIMDNLAFFNIYYPNSNFIYSLVNWQRTYDNWQVQAGIFFLTGDQAPAMVSALNTAGTSGIQVNLVFNH